MAMIEINFKPSIKDLRVFTLILFVFSLIIGSWLVFVHGMSMEIGYWIWGIGSAVSVLGLILPPFIRIVYIVLSIIALPIGFVVSFLLLAVIYYLIMTPIGLLVRLFGKDPMLRKFEPQKESYWIERPVEFDRKRYFRQF